MNTTPFRVFAVAAILSTCGAAIVSGQKERDSILENITKHRQWTRATPIPVVVPIDASSLVD